MYQRSRRETYKLVQVPSANAEVALVLVHALAEVANVRLAGRVAIGAVGGVALPQSGVHGLGLGGSCLLGLGGGTGTAAEETTDGVADGGADCDTTG